MRRRLLMARQKNNPWEKLDYLTIIPLDFDITVYIYNAYAGYWRYDEETDEEWEEYVYCPFEYSLNDGSSWMRVYGNDGYAHQIKVGKNQTLKLRSELDDFFSDTDDRDFGGSLNISSNSSVHTFAVTGTPMSLLARQLKTTPNINLSKTYLSRCFYNLFGGASGLIEILNPKTFLPATTVGDNCYSGMFLSCINLLNAPELPAKTLGEGCYDTMFSYCRSLINAPELPAERLTPYCYYRMFDDCESLVNPPQIKAIYSASNCCEKMFYQCKSLVKAPELSMTTLSSQCFANMFYGCSSLIYIKAMFTTAPSVSYTGSWVSGVASTGTFVKNKNATWSNTFGASAIPKGWTVITE